MRGITEIVYVKGGLGKSPAATNRKTGVVYLNIPYWDDLKFEHKLFVLLHELGHIVNDTSNEFTADDFAFKKYSELGYSLNESVLALSQVLSLTTDEQFERIEHGLERALNYDSTINKNQKANEALRAYFMNENLDGFNFKKFKKGVGKTFNKVLTKTPLKYTPAGLLAKDNRSKFKKAVNRVATKTPLRYTPMGLVAGALTKNRTRKRVSPTADTAIKSVAEPLLKAATMPAYTAPVATKPNQSQTAHWSESEEPEIQEDDLNEDTELNEGEEFENNEDNEAINEGLDGFNFKKFVKKVGDAAAPFADMALRNLPGGNSLVAMRKGIVQNAKDNNKANQKPDSTLPIAEKPVSNESKPKDNNNTLIIIGVVVLVLIIILFIVFNKKK